MTTAAPAKDNQALEGPIFSTFLKYLIPSVVGLLAMSTASIIDGVFIGNYVGSDALAAVNLIMPLMSFIFGFTLTLSIGGSVRAGKYIGEKNTQAAGAIFSKTLVIMAVLATINAVIGYVFHEQIFALFGANDQIAPLMADYFIILLPFLIPQMLMIVLYFFVRIDGYPNLAATALVLGSVINVGLDYWFIAILNWGLEGAAFATGISQLVPFLVLLSYFIKPERQLSFSLKQDHWFEIFSAFYNGISEFINEISAGVIAFILNWLLITKVGVAGVAAVTVINYLLMIGYMLYFATGDACQVIISQNLGAKKLQRIKQFLKTAVIFVAVVSAVCITLMLFFPDTLVQAFLQRDEVEVIGLANSYIEILWLMFLAVGFNMLVSAYLTAAHLAKQSAILSFSRSLVLPVGFLLGFNWLLPEENFIWALPIAEFTTLIIAISYFVLHRPSKLAVEN